MAVLNAMRWLVWWINISGLLSIRIEIQKNGKKIERKFFSFCHWATWWFALIAALQVLVYIMILFSYKAISGHIVGNSTTLVYVTAMVYVISTGILFASPRLLLFTYRHMSTASDYIRKADELLQKAQCKPMKISKYELIFCFLFLIFLVNSFFLLLKASVQINSCFCSTGWRVWPFKYPNIPNNYWICRAFTCIHHSGHLICDCNANPSALHGFPHGLLRHGPTYRIGDLKIVSTTSDVKDYSRYSVEHSNDCWFKQVLVPLKNKLCMKRLIAFGNRSFSQKLKALNHIHYCLSRSVEEFGLAISPILLVTISIKVVSLTSAYFLLIHSMIQGSLVNLLPSNIASIIMDSSLLLFIFKTVDLPTNAVSSISNKVILISNFEILLTGQEATSNFDESDSLWTK